MNECEEEWISARQYGIPLPNCTDLPEEITSEEDQDYNYLCTVKYCRRQDEELIRLGSCPVIMYERLFKESACV